MKGHKIRKKYSKIEMISCILLDQNGIKIVIKINIVCGIHTNQSRLNITQLSMNWLPKNNKEILKMLRIERK